MDQQLPIHSPLTCPQQHVPVLGDPTHVELAPVSSIHLVTQKCLLLPLQNPLAFLESMLLRGCLSKLNLILYSLFPVRDIILFAEESMDPMIQ